MVRTLIASGLPQPDPTTGRVVEALWKAGFFRLRGILIGTTAYQCYGGVLRRRFAGAAMRTADADFAQYLAISREAKDSLPPMNEVLSAVDTTFTPIMDSLDGRHVVAFRNKDGYRVEFLTPHRGASHRASTPVRMPALGGVSAIQLSYLDFLLRDPIRSVMLHGAGVPVTVPSPARYAIHKLIVATQRMPSSSAKRGKDIAQAAELIKAIGEEHLDEDLILAWIEAWDRGPKWRVALATGRAALPGAAQESLDLSASIAVAMSGNAISPSDYGLEGPL